MKKKIRFSPKHFSIITCALLINFANPALASHQQASHCEIYPIDVQFLHTAYRDYVKYFSRVTFVTNFNKLDHLRRTGIFYPEYSQPFTYESEYDSFSADIDYASIKDGQVKMYPIVYGTPFFETSIGDYFWLQTKPYETIRLAPNDLIPSSDGNYSPSISNYNFLQSLDLFKCLNFSEFSFVSQGIDNFSENEIINYLTLNRANQKLIKVLLWSISQNADYSKKPNLIKYLQNSTESESILLKISRLLSIQNPQKYDTNSMNAIFTLLQSMSNSPYATDQTQAKIVELLNKWNFQDKNDLLADLLQKPSVGKKTFQSTLSILKDNSFSNFQINSHLLKIINSPNISETDTYNILIFIFTHPSALPQIEEIASDILNNRRLINDRLVSSIISNLFFSYSPPGIEMAPGYADIFVGTFDLYMNILDLGLFYRHDTWPEMIRSFPNFSEEKLSQQEIFTLMSRMIDTNPIFVEEAWQVLDFFKTSKLTTIYKTELINKFKRADFSNMSNGYQNYFIKELESLNH